MLTIYKNGNIFQKYTLGQLLQSMESLEPTASHFEWRFLANDSISISTVEGTVDIDIESGKVYFEIKSKQIFLSRTHNCWLSFTL